MVKYTDEYISWPGAHLYRLEETDLIGKYVYAARSAKIGKKVELNTGVIIESRVQIGNNVRIGGGALIKSGTRIDDDATVGIWSQIGERSYIGKNAVIDVWANIGEDAYIGTNSIYDNMTIIRPTGYRQRSLTTFWRHKDGYLRVSVGNPYLKNDIHFSGTLDQLKEAAEKGLGDGVGCKYYTDMIDFAKKSMGEYREIDHGTD